MAYIQIKVDFLTDEKNHKQLIKELRQWHIDNPINMSRMDISTSDPITVHVNE